MTINIQINRGGGSSRSSPGSKPGKCLCILYTLALLDLADQDAVTASLKQPISSMNGHFSPFFGKFLPFLEARRGAAGCNSLVIIYPYSGTRVVIPIPNIQL